jgi:hypothetical protein
MSTWRNLVRFFRTQLPTHGKERRFSTRRFVMQVVYERCAAIDVHQKTAVTTVLITQANGHVRDARRRLSQP